MVINRNQERLGPNQPRAGGQPPQPDAIVSPPENGAQGVFIIFFHNRKKMQLFFGKPSKKQDGALPAAAAPPFPLDITAPTL